MTDYDRMKITLEIDDASLSVGWRNDDKSKNHIKSLLDTFDKVLSAVKLVNPLVNSVINQSYQTTVPQATFYSADMNSLFKDFARKETQTKEEYSNKEETKDEVSNEVNKEEVSNEVNKEEVSNEEGNEVSKEENGKEEKNEEEKGGYLWGRK